MLHLCSVGCAQDPCLEKAGFHAAEAQKLLAALGKVFVAAVCD